MADRVDDTYDKLANDIGTGFKKRMGKITELYSFHCGKCGYQNVLDIKELECGCGNKLQGILVYRSIDGTVVYDMRAGKKRRK